MKKHIVWLLIIFSICSSAIPNIIKRNRPAAVSDTIPLVIYKSIDYNSGAYDSTTVQLIISIQKIEGSKHAAIWNQKYKAKPLKDYPGEGGAQIQTITIPQFDKDKQQIEITYTRVYNSFGYQLKLQNQVLLHKPPSDTLEISI